MSGTLARPAPSRREGHAMVGLVVFLGTAVMLFAALLLAYGILRVRSPSWPPPGWDELPRGTAAANTLPLLAASLALRRAARAGTSARWWFAGALALGAGFLVSQAVLWRQLVISGLGPGSGLLSDAFLALSAFHALHVLGGLIAGWWAGLRRARLVIVYWDFVLVVWAIIFVAVFLV